MRILCFLALVGCSGSSKDSAGGGGDTSVQGDSGGGGDSSGGDTSDGSGGTCNTANEDCGPGTCDGEGSNMLPGADCLSCHDGSGGGDDRVMDDAPKWYAAGTLFTDIYGSSGASNVTVKVTDSKGTVATMTTSSKGNFYTSKKLVPPLSATIESDAGSMTMGQTVSTGACNSCHKCDGEAGGKMYEP